MRRIFIIAIVACAVLVTCIVLIIYPSRSNRPDPIELAAISKVAQPIIEAIEKYKKDHSLYPDNLEQLVPNYITSIPKPDWGINRWDYGTGFEKVTYSISVRLKDDDYQCYAFERYKNGKAAWVYDQ